MTQGNRLGEVFIQIKGAADSACYLSHLKGMSEPGDVVVVKGSDEHLSFVFETPESLAMNYAVAVALEIGTYRAGFFRSQPAT